MTAFEQFLAGKPLVYHNWLRDTPATIVATWDNCVLVFQAVNHRRTFRFAVSETWARNWFDRLHSAKRECFIEAHPQGLRYLDWRHEYLE